MLVPERPGVVDLEVVVEVEGLGWESREVRRHASEPTVRRPRRDLLVTGRGERRDREVVAAAPRRREERVAAALGGEDGGETGVRGAPPEQGRGVLPRRGVADEVRRAGAGDEGARRTRPEVVPAARGVGVEVGGLDPALVRDHRPHRAAGDRGGVPALAVGHAREGCGVRTHPDEQGPARRMVVVEAHQGCAVGRDRGPAEAVARRDAGVGLGPERAQAQPGHAVRAVRTGGGVGQRVGAERPGAADAGRRGRGAVEGPGAARAEVDEGGDVGGLRELVLADHERVRAVEEGVGDPGVGAGPDRARMRAVEARGAASRVDGERPAGADGDHVAGRARDGLPVEQVGRGRDDRRVVAGAGGRRRRGRRRRRAAGTSLEGAVLGGPEVGPPSAVLDVPEPHAPSARTPARRSAAVPAWATGRRTGIRRRGCAGSAPRWRGTTCRRCATGRGR